MHERVDLGGTEVCPEFVTPCRPHWKQVIDVSGVEPGRKLKVGAGQAVSIALTECAAPCGPFGEKRQPRAQNCGL